MCIELSGDLAEGKLVLLIWESPAGPSDRAISCYVNLQLSLKARLSESTSANILSSKTPLRLLTKGDNNLADDTELYARGQSFLNRKEDVIGSVVGFIPFVGYVTILLSEHPWLKQLMLGIMGLMVVLQRE